jgi:hypothetical protein
MRFIDTSSKWNARPINLVSIVVERWLQSVTNGREQMHRVERLMQEFDGASVQCLPPNVIVIMRGDEDDGQFWMFDPDAALHFDAVHARHSHVGNHAGGRDHLPDCRKSSADENNSTT